MRPLHWYLGVGAIVVALVAHAAFPRYAWQNQRGILIRLDRWTGQPSRLDGSPLPDALVPRPPQPAANGYDFSGLEPGPFEQALAKVRREDRQKVHALAVGACTLFILPLVGFDAYRRRRRALL